MGNHALAQNYYQQALKIMPNEPSVMSNLGLSYALSKRLSDAEDILTRASSLPNASMRVRQNLALVLALEGKFKEAEELSLRDMSPEQAHANIETVRTTISQNNSWRELAKQSQN
jgi:Flp pilus assembly protein TadD